MNSNLPKWLIDFHEILGLLMIKHFIEEKEESIHILNISNTQLKLLQKEMIKNNIALYITEYGHIIYKGIFKGEQKPAGVEILSRKIELKKPPSNDWDCNNIVYNRRIK